MGEDGDKSNKKLSLEYIEEIFENIEENRYFEKLRMYIDLLDAAGVLRRYFVMNGFDGTLAVIGVITGAHIAGILDPKVIIGTAVGASIAMGISGFVGALITERAERLKEVRELEKTMFIKLENSMIYKAVNVTTLLAAIVDSLAPILFSLIALIPFYLALIGFLSRELAFIASLLVSSLELFILGAILAKIAKEKFYKYGFYMLMAGLSVSLLGLIIEGVT